MRKISVQEELGGFSGWLAAIVLLESFESWFRKRSKKPMSTKTEMG